MPRGLNNTLEYGGAFLRNIIINTVKTAAAPPLEAWPAYQQMWDIAMLSESHHRIDYLPDSEKENFLAERRKFHYRLAFFTVTPLVLAASASVVVFHLNVQSAIYVDSLFKSFLELGSPEFIKDLAYNNFVNGMILYSVSYMASHLVSSAIEAVSAYCSSQASAELQNEWTDTIYAPELQSKLTSALHSNPKTTSTAGSAQNYLQHVIESNFKLTTSYTMSLSHIIMAFTQLSRLDPMFLGYMVGFNFASNLIYSLLTSWRNSCREELEKARSASTSISYETIQNSTMQAQQKLGTVVKDMLNQSQSKLSQLERKKAMLEQVCNVWKSIHESLRFALTYGLIGTALYKGSIPTALRATATTCAESMSDFFASRAKYDDNITSLKGYIGLFSKMIKTVKDDIPAKVVKTKSHTEKYVELKNMVARAGSKVILSISNAKFAVGKVHIIKGENGEGKSVLLQSMQGVPTRLEVSGEILMPIKSEDIGKEDQNPMSSTLYLPAQPFIFKNHALDIDSIFGNITVHTKQFDLVQLKELSSRIVNTKVAQKTLIANLSESIEKKQNKIAQDIENCKKIDGIPPEEIETQRLRQSHLLEKQKMYIGILEDARNTISELKNYNGNDAKALAKLIVKSLLYLTNFGELVDRFEDDAEGLSTGQSKIIGFIRAIISNPKTLPIDETFSNLTEINKRQMVRTLCACLPETTLFIVNHELDVIEEFKSLRGQDVVEWEVRNMGISSRTV